MRFSMGVHKNRYGVYFTRRKVPKDLQQAVARVLGGRKESQIFLQRSLETKDSKTAKRKAPAVLMEFDGVLARARVLAEDRPVRSSLSQAEIERMGEHHYALFLISDDEFVRIAPEEEQAFRDDVGDDETGWVEPVPKYGLSRGQMADRRDTMARNLPEAEAALARGDIGHVQFHIEQVLEAFHVHLDRDCDAYRRLGMEILRRRVLVLRALDQRSKGEPIPTPKLPLVAPRAATVTGETLTAAFTGWQKARSPAAGTLAEYDRAIRLFTELHGDLPVVGIKRSHARTFREALQDVPRQRKGKLQKATLPDLVEWRRANPDAQRLSEGTINKLLGGVQAVSVWAHRHGLIPDDAVWADPFAGMRLEEEASDRDTFTVAELNILFASPVYAAGARPVGGKGEVAYWLPLLALFTGARRGELAGLTVADVAEDETIGWALSFIPDEDRGKTLKTKQSQRIVPMHSELKRLGFLEFVGETKRAEGAAAWLFKPISPASKDGAKAWSKWFGRYLRDISIIDSRKVFHSFRHTFIDALRAAGSPEEINTALVGQAIGGSVHRSYGAKDVVRRFGKQLTKAVASVKYPKLDLSHLIKHRSAEHCRQRKTR
jgi:integrase